MSPSELSAALRAVARRIGSSSSPSRSAVAAELRRVLSSLPVSRDSQSASSTKVVVNENWTESDARSVMSEHRGVSLRQGYLGEFGVEMPAEEAAHFEVDAGDGGYVFDSWKEASDVSAEPGEEPYLFEVVED